MSETITEKRKIQLSSATSVFDIHDRAMVRMAEWGVTNRYPTGWPDFDKYIGGGFGLRSDGELVVVAGETKVGKSTFVANVALRIAQNNVKVEYIPLENSYEQIYGMLCKSSGLSTLKDYKDLLYLPDEDLIFGDEAWNAEDLLAHMQFMIDSRGVNVFVLDHLNFMFENEAQLRDELMRVRVVMRKLSRFCNKNKVTVLAVSHLNKPATGKIEKPTIHRIYGSQSIAGAATKVLLLSEADPMIMPDQTERRRVECNFVASRHTQSQKNGFMFDASQSQWSEIGVSLI